MKLAIPTAQRICTRMGWHLYYADLFNKTGRETAATLALWHLILFTAFGED